MRKLLYLFMLLCVGLQMRAQTVVDIIVNSPNHNTLEAAVIAADLAGALSGPGPFTVFAPTDAAFAALPDGSLDYLLENPSGDLTNILLYHVVLGQALSTDLTNGDLIQTLQGQSVEVVINPVGISINNALVTVADIVTDNGVVHVIDAVLLPSIEGCTASDACNWNPVANLDNGTCVLAGSPCDDNNASTLNDVYGSDCICSGALLGCTNTAACNFNSNATFDDGSCFFSGDSCDDNNPESTNDIYGADCVCAGTLPSNTVVDIIVNSPVHTTLEAAVIAAGLADDLSGSGPFTVFAPTDDAFAALPEGVLEILLADPTGALADILLYHVVAGQALSTELSDGQVITTLLGSDITVTISMGNVMINEATVIVADLIADNGVVHVLDAVLIPPVMPESSIMDIVAGSSIHNTLEAALVASGLNETLGNPGDYTLFAPTDAAFDLLPAGTVEALLADPTGALVDVLLYHVLGGTVLSTDLSDGMSATTFQGDNVVITIDGSNVFVNNAQVIVADLMASNGVVHVIDAVLIPSAETNTVVDIIVNSPDHNTLEAAVIAAGLVDDLSGAGPFTVFAPTDAAFAALPAGVLDELLLDPTGDLANILLYHVVSGLALSSDLSDGQVINTLLGEGITVSVSMDGVMINDANVTVADIIADNGVVHIIDAVLLPALPPSNTILDVVVNSADHNTLEAAVVAAGLQDALSGPGPLTLFAPTDAAFAALPEVLIDALLADPAGDLTSVLLYHVVAGQALSSSLIDGQEITTLLGQGITVTIDANGVFINGNAQVIVADILADNGVVHVIDAVLVPSIEGCTASDACNFNPVASVDNGTCQFPGTACDDNNESTLNDVLGADCVCAGVLLGCINSAACNFNSAAGFDDGSCYFSGDSCDDNNPDTENDVYGTDCVCAGVVVTNTVVDIIVNSTVHNTLETAVVAAGLADDLSGDGPFTVFAPTDAAFEALSDGLLDLLLADPTGALAQVLLYHVVSGVALSSDLSDGQVITTLLNQDITVTLTMDGVMINNANVIVADIIADNGVVHVIDAVLVPSISGCTASDACNYSPVATIDDSSCALPGFPCDDNNENTINDAYSADCTCSGDLLGCTNEMACNYNAEAIFDDASCFFAGDNCDDNDPSTTGDVYGADCTCAGVVSSGTVVDVIVNSDVHNTLEAAVVAAGLVDALSGAGPFTVFAPTDDAFAALPEGLLEELLSDPSGELTNILLYHVVEGLALSTDLSDQQAISTMFGEDILITILGDMVYVNGVLVIVADVIASNGVVHVINAVLTPPVQVIPGCTAPDACNFDALATVDDGSCQLPGSSCDDGDAATVNDIIGADCTCAGVTAGCTASIACNYDANAVFDDGSCFFPGDACDDNNAETINDVYTETCGCEGIISDNTVADIIINSPVHNTLEAALIAADLVGALSSTGPFTVFAPTDDAFSALPPGTLAELLADPSGALTEILLYHVVGSTVLSTSLSDGLQLQMLNGDFVTVTFVDGNVLINDVALVIQADLIADNGVVHVISAVLTPPIPPVSGCTAPDACNFNSAASIDDGSCQFPGAACDDNNESTVNDVLGVDCVCAGDLLGCTNSAACNFNADAVVDDASCQFPGDSCDDGNAATINDVVGSDCVCAGTVVTNTVVDVIVNSADHTILETAVIAAELADDLSGTGPFTVFAPTDAAFAALPAGVLDELLLDPTGDLANILLYHVANGAVLSTDLIDGQTITTLLGEDVTVTITGDGVFINDAQVVVADIIADNGVVHVIDGVLLPPPPPPSNTILDIVVNSANHNTLEAAVIAAGLQSALSGPGPLTVFAPTDAAFDALPAGVLDALLADPTGALTQVLLYHAIGGVALSTDLEDGMMITTLQGQDVVVSITADGVFINDAEVIVADIIADNGVVHVIDVVLVPELNPQPETVVDIIVNSPAHNTLETAVIAAGLADDLSGDGPFTVFAPTDAAFAALPAGVLDALLDDPTGALAQVLLYHVVAGEALSSSLTNGQTITTLQGQDVTVSINAGDVFINGAQVIMADILADNGVVHVIDAVLTPSTSVVENELSEVSVYPNPAFDNLTISVPALMSNTSYAIYTSTGALVSSGLLNNMTSTLSLNDLSQGMYQLKLMNDKECVTRAFMKK